MESMVWDMTFSGGVEISSCNPGMDNLVKHARCQLVIDKRVFPLITSGNRKSKADLV